jgi:CDP-glucose 4,6-dehydratase
MNQPSTSNHRPTQDFWRDKKVLVTGHTGFKGSWLCLWLQRLGANVVGYALDPPSTPNLFDVARVGDGMMSVRGDVRDLEFLSNIMTDQKPEIVFHLAAQSLVRRSYDDPVETYSTNVMGTVNVLEAVRRVLTVRVVIIVTSDKCYENQEWIWGYRENDPMGGHDPYSSSKGCVELVTAAYMKSFFSIDRFGSEHHVALASVRAGNVIGGGDWGTDRLVPDCLRALSVDEEIILRNPNAIRPWQHVLDPLGGYMLLAERLWGDGSRFAGAWNFGPSDNDLWTVEDVVREIIRLWGGGTYRSESEAHPHEAHQLRLDCGKARIQLGWSSRFNIQEALSWSAEWYKMFYGNASQSELLDFTTRQICQFMDRSNNAKE